MRYQNEFIAGNANGYAFVITTESPTYKVGKTAANLWWTDGVANDWQENFSSVSDALARLATLQFCQEREWENGFTHSPEIFVKHAHAFFNHETQVTLTDITEAIVEEFNSEIPQLNWELINTGGGCTAIQGTHEHFENICVMITNGHGEAPITTLAPMQANFYNGTKAVEAHEVFNEHLQELLNKVSAQIEQLIQTERTATLTDRLADWALSFEKGEHFNPLNDEDRDFPLREDLLEAVYLINLHTQEEEN